MLPFRYNEAALESGRGRGGGATFMIHSIADTHFNYSRLMSQMAIYSDDSVVKRMVTTH